MKLQGQMSAQVHSVALPHSVSNARRRRLVSSGRLGLDVSVSWSQSVVLVALSSCVKQQPLGSRWSRSLDPLASNAICTQLIWIPIND